MSQKIQKYKLNKTEKIEYNNLIKRLKSTTKVNKNSVYESERDYNSRMNLMRADYQTFINYYFEGDVTTTQDGKKVMIPNPKFHFDVFDKIRDKGNMNLCCTWSRSVSKTTITSLFALMWSILIADSETDFKPGHILIVGNKKSDAVKRLTKLAGHFLYNERIKKDFGEMKRDGYVWNANMIELAPLHITIQAISKDESVRGANDRWGQRPNMIIMDDLSDDILVQNATRVDDVWSSITGNILQTVDISLDNKIIYVENDYHPNSLVRKFYTSYIKDFVKNGGNKKEVFHSHVPIRDKWGQSCWDERFTTAAIARMENLDPLTFQREYLMQYVTKAYLFKPEHIHFIDATNEEIFTKIISYYDPSLTSGTKSDFKAVTTVGITKDNRFVVLDIFCRRTTFDVVIEHMYDVFRKYPMVTFYIEDLFSQSTPHYVYFEKEAIRRGYKLPLVKDNSAKGSKIGRIESMLPYFINGDVLFNIKLEGEQDYIELRNQLYAFNLDGSQSNDDGPDALQSAINKLQRYRSSRGNGIPSIIKTRRRLEY